MEILAMINILQKVFNFSSVDFIRATLMKWKKLFSTLIQSHQQH